MGGISEHSKDVRILPPTTDSCPQNSTCLEKQEAHSRSTVLDEGVLTLPEGVCHICSSPYGEGRHAVFVRLHDPSKNNTTPEHGGVSDQINIR